jgi:glycosyltransferase involved in cell wall biosynthesis
MTERSRILLLIPHLGGGGAERVASIVASRLDPDKYDVHLGVITGTAAQAGSLPASVTVHVLGTQRVRKSALGIWRLVRRVRPHAILSGMAHLNLLVLLLRPAFPRKTRVLVRQNAAPLKRDAGQWTPLLYRMLYRTADAVVCQTRQMAHEMARASGSSANLHVLANPVDVPAMRTHAADGEKQWTGPGPHLLAVGRLAPEKGFDLLLRAMALLREQFSSADLTILGAGPEEMKLRALVEELAVGEAVRFAGHVTKPEAWFASATMFVSSSRREGMPNALLEAAAAGLPIVATPVEGGLSQLIAAKEGVWLAREISAAALAETMASALKALGTGQRFEHAWIDEFGAERAIAGYEALIDAVLAGSPSGAAANASSGAPPGDVPRATEPTEQSPRELAQRT